MAPRHRHRARPFGPALAALAVVVASAGAAGGCTSGDGRPATTIRFEPAAETPRPLGTVPFPSELYRDDAGAIAIGPIPGATGSSESLDALRELLGRRAGFCTTCAAIFEVTGSLDPASIAPSAGSETAPSLEDPVLLVDVDPASPERGRLRPLRTHWDPKHALLSAGPGRGVVLHPERRYAVAVTSRVQDADGRPLQPSPPFRRIRDDDLDGAPDERAADLLQPALAELESIGVPAAQVAGLATFTTDDSARTLVRVRELVHDAPAPRADVERVRDASELDGLLGVPSESRPGIDVPPAPGTEGTRSIPHETAQLVVTGTFDAPRLVEGSGTEVGVLRRDAEGHLASGPREEVPFVLIVPEGAALDRLPVVISLHGFNASRITGFALADTAGRAGAAVLAIDAYQHGDRAASATDERNDLRDVPQPDGFAETSPLEVSSRVFGLSGLPDGAEPGPGYALGAFAQFAADAMSTVRFVRSGDLEQLRQSAAELESLQFDPDRVFVVGNSLGAVVTTSVLAVEPDVAGAVLNVWPGSIMDNLVASPEFRPVTETLLLPVLGVRDRYREPERELAFNPVVDLLRWALEPVDPLALAPRLLRLPAVEGPRPDILVQLAALDEVAVPAAGESTVSAAGIPSAPELTFAPSEQAELPAKKNVTTSSGTVTAVAYQFPEAAHGMLEVVDQQSRYEPPVLPPFMERDEPLPLANPIVEVHGQIESFVRSRLDSDRATVERP